MMNVYRRERAKSILITLLFLLLLASTLLNWVYDREDITLLPGANTAEPAALPVTRQEPARPVLSAILRGGEMFAAGGGDASAGTVYERFRMLLGETLASASERRAITRAAWEAEWEKDLAFFEFLDPVPVWALAEGLSFSASPAVDGLMLKSFILCGDGLFIFTGTEYLRCEVYLEFSIPEQLEDALYKAHFVNGVIVYDREYAYPAVTLSERFREEPYLSDILTAMGFNPNTKFRYTQADGDIVFVDEQRTLRVSQSGLITYHDGTVYADEPFDEREAIRGCLNAIPLGAAFWGGGRLMFSRTELFEGGASIEFNYTLNGALFLERGSVFVVKGSRIVDASIQLCPASPGTESADIMPRRQAALLLEEDKDLSLCYTDSGSGIWMPQWYSR